MRQGQITLAFNGIAATQEMHCLKEKALRRARLEEGTSVICKYGPIRVSDARLRVARDEYNRQAAQEEEEHRLLKRAQLEIQVYLLQKSSLPPVMWGETNQFYNNLVCTTRARPCRVFARIR
jgi:hypothetical protein